MGSGSDQTPAGSGASVDAASNNNDAFSSGGNASSEPETPGDGGPTTEETASATETPGDGRPTAEETAAPPESSGAEVCDNEDNDSDGRVDEELSRSCGSDVGVCTVGLEACSAGTWGACSGRTAAQETCNALDDDCDGTADEDNPGGGASCGTGHTGQGECRLGTEVCRDGSLRCQGEVGPTAETCDNKDNDCDNETDEDVPEEETNECGGCGDLDGTPDESCTVTCPDLPIGGTTMDFPFLGRTECSGPNSLRCVMCVWVCTTTDETQFAAESCAQLKRIIPQGTALVTCNPADNDCLL